MMSKKASMTPKPDAVIGGTTSLVNPMGTPKMKQNIPKYIKTGVYPLEEMRQVLKVLARYNTRDQIVRMYTETDSGQSFNLLALMLALLSDYHENGIYTNTQDIIESNGLGEILWDKTINEAFALLSANRPYYPELKTRRRAQDEYDYFRRLHACVLTAVSEELDKTDLPGLFDIATVRLSDELMDDFGDTRYILDRIEKELNVEFNTRKQRVLMMLHAYLSHSGSLADDDGLSIFGTNSFNLVWEKVCGEVLNNMLSQPLGSIRLPVPLSEGYSRRAKLIDIIERPVWSGEGFCHLAKETLIQDAVSIENCGDDWRLVIYDAKYYVAAIGPGTPLTGQPGIESITKQYLYRLAFKPFMDEHRIPRAYNCFLLPHEGGSVLDRGTASLPMMDALGLERIQVRFLPAGVMYKCYLERRRLQSDYVLM